MALRDIGNQPGAAAAGPQQGGGLLQSLTGRSRAALKQWEQHRATERNTKRNRTPSPILDAPAAYTPVRRPPRAAPGEGGRDSFDSLASPGILESPGDATPPAREKKNVVVARHRRPRRPAHARARPQASGACSQARAHRRAAACALVAGAEPSARPRRRPRPARRRARARSARGAALELAPARSESFGRRRRARRSSRRARPPAGQARAGCVARPARPRRPRESLRRVSSFPN